MTPPISSDIKEKLEDLYYNQKNIFGRDKLYYLAREKGIDVSRRQLWEWLKSQMLHQLYMPAEESKELQSTVLNKPHDQIGIDLIDMSNYLYDNYKYILTAIDLFSKKAYSIALKDKSQKEINKAIKEIIKESQPKSIRSDKEAILFQKNFKKFYMKII